MWAAYKITPKNVYPAIVLFLLKCNELNFNRIINENSMGIIDKLKSDKLYSQTTILIDVSHRLYRNLLKRFLLKFNTENYTMPLNLNVR